MGLIGLISGLKEPDLGLSGGGGMYGWTDIRKFTPVSYRISALWGNCPKRLTKHFGSSSNAKNTRNAKKAKVFPTNQPTEGPTNSRTVMGYRVTCTQLIAAQRR